MRLIRTAPQVAYRDCDHCQKWMYDEKTGLLAKTGTTDRPIARPPGTAPCRLPHVGCPKGSPEDSKELKPHNDEAYRHYLECRAVGRFPEDPIVRRNAAIIRDVEDSVEESKRLDFQRQLIELALLKFAPGK